MQSGAWTLYGGGYYDTVNIAVGATLIVDDHVLTALGIDGEPAGAGARRRARSRRVAHRAGRRSARVGGSDPPRPEQDEGDGYRAVDEELRAAERAHPADPGTAPTTRGARAVSDRGRDRVDSATSGPGRPTEWPESPDVLELLNVCH